MSAEVVTPRIAFYYLLYRYTVRMWNSASKTWIRIGPRNLWRIALRRMQLEECKIDHQLAESIRKLEEHINSLDSLEELYSIKKHKRTAELTFELTSTVCRAIAARLSLLVDCKSVPHVTIKLKIGSSELEGMWVLTTGRSTTDGRSHLFGDRDQHSPTKSTPFAALMGISDGQTHWLRHRCFADADLQKRVEFVCSRPNHLELYRSTVVVPIHFHPNTSEDFFLFGFLTLDWKDPEGFERLPNTFDYKDKPYLFRRLCAKSALWQKSAAIADTLAGIFYTAGLEWEAEATFLQRFLRGNKDQPGRNRP